VSARWTRPVWRGLGRTARDLAVPATVALGLAGLALLVALTWQFDAGTGPELVANFELGPLGADRIVQRTARRPVEDFVGVQILGRAIGTVDPLEVVVDAYAGPLRIATSTGRFFPNERLQPVRIAFKRPLAAPALRLDLRMRAGVPGAVLYGATRGDAQPPGELALDGRVEFADQDLALRPVHRTTTWAALGRLAAQGPLGPGVAIATAGAASALAGLALVGSAGRAGAAWRASTRRAGP